MNETIQSKYKYIINYEIKKYNSVVTEYFTVAAQLKKEKTIVLPRIQLRESDEELDERQIAVETKNYNEKLCEQAIKEILSGNIEPAPLQKMSDKTSKECAYCEFAGICGKEHSRFGEGRRINPAVNIGYFDLSDKTESEQNDAGGVSDGN